jgi:hypothetical protein
MSTEQHACFPPNRSRFVITRSPTPRWSGLEVPEVLDFLKENGMSILIGVGLAWSLFVGISAFRNFRKTQESSASSMLFSSQAAEQFQQLVDQYPKTAAAPLAQLSLASEYFDQGQFEMAQNAFATFAQTYPTHSFALAAELGQVQSLEALGRLDEALDGYTKFAEAHKGALSGVRRGVRAGSLPGVAGSVDRGPRRVRGFYAGGSQGPLGRSHGIPCSTWTS